MISVSKLGQAIFADGSEELVQETLTGLIDENLKELKAKNYTNTPREATKTSSLRSRLCQTSAFSGSSAPCALSSARSSST